MSKTYRAVFFDLDHTLWDYDRNSRETLQDLYAFHEVHKYRHVDFESFHDEFQNINLKLWDQYDRGLIGREVIRDQRFEFLLEALNVSDNQLARALSESYYSISPTKRNLVSNAIDVLDYLYARYPLFLVTNGYESIQSTKVKSGQIEKYFKAIITSERAGHKKPSKEIFEYTLAIDSLDRSEVVMIGDNLLTDIAGSINAGIDVVFFNPKKTPCDAKVTYEISDLLELKQIL